MSKHADGHNREVKFKKIGNHCGDDNEVDNTRLGKPNSFKRIRSRSQSNGNGAKSRKEAHSDSHDRANT